MKNSFKFEVTEGCTEITPDGEKEKLRQRLLISVVRCCGIEQNPTVYKSCCYFGYSPCDV